MKSRLLVAGALCALAAVPAGAWWPEGHTLIARGAVRALPKDVPAFFREGGELVGHCAQDPDVAKNRDTPNVRDVEEPEHYIDWELLEGRPLPGTRYEFVKLCAEAKLDPSKVGTVPYSTTEWTERLAVAFAEHRRWPENPNIRTKCLVYAGFLAHYAGDLCMPLHTTIHYDGRVKSDGASPHTGIHAKVDSLIEKVGLTPEELARDQKVELVDRILPAVLKEIDQSRALIDRTYALEPALPPGDNTPWTPSAEVKAFTLERGRESTRFLASLYLTAWRNSARVTLPPWLDRGTSDGKPR